MNAKKLKLHIWWVTTIKNAINTLVFQTLSNYLICILFYSIALLTNNAIENELFAPKTIISLEKMFIKVDNEK